MLVVAQGIVVRGAIGAEFDDEDRVAKAQVLQLFEVFHYSNAANSLNLDIETAVKDLFYTSETDAEILIFVGSKADTVTKENLLIQTKSQSVVKVEEKDFNEFFNRLTAIQNWFGDEEKDRQKK